MALGDVDGGGNLDLVAGNHYQANRLYRRLVLYHTAHGQATSLEVNTESCDISNATLTPSASLPRNTGVDYWLSNNGGTRWYLVRPGVNFIFPIRDSELRWRAELHSLSPVKTPRISQIDITETEANRLYLPLVMKAYCGCGPDNYEPNDWCDQAYGPLTSGQTYQSWISCCDVTTYKKSDCFYIDISTTNAINIYLTDIPAGTDYDLYLYRNPSDDPDNPADESTNPGNSPETISYIPLVTGTYYIRVYSYSGYSTSPYSLRVTYD